VLTVAVTQSHYRSLFRVTDTSPVCLETRGGVAWVRSVRRDEPLDLDQQFLTAQVSLE
jgi:hypothetical protein